MWKLPYQKLLTTVQVYSAVPVSVEAQDDLRVFTEKLLFGCGDGTHLQTYTLTELSDGDTLKADDKIAIISQNIAQENAQTLQQF